MSIHKRRIVTVIFVLLFFILAPLIVFYAKGDIWSNGFNFLKTGGIFVRATESGSEIYINGKLEDTTNFFSRDYFIKNLRPVTYEIVVKKTGYNDWKNNLRVYSNRVTETRAFALPAKIEAVDIPEFNKTEVSAGTTTKTILKLNPDYDQAKKMFLDSYWADQILTVKSTTTGKISKYLPGTKENPIESRHMLAWAEGKDVFVSWTGNPDSIPKYFCEDGGFEIKCQNTLKVYSFESNVRSLDYFLGDTEIILVAAGDRVEAIEAETNPDNRPQVVYEGDKPDFRLSGSSIIIKVGKLYKEINI